MKTLWFVVPVHGRLPLTAICLRQLRRTCDALADHEIAATAVVIADRDNLRELRSRLKDHLGFATVERDNQFLSRKFNDGIQLALDERHNPHPADYVVPCGSDDWLDYHIFTDLPAEDTMVGFQRLSVVREDGAEMMTLLLSNLGGAGIRIYPRQLMEPLGFRPADQDRARGCDTSILVNVKKHHGDKLRVEHRDLHSLQIVDWKSADAQLTKYENCARRRHILHPDPFAELADVYPDEALAEMREYYGHARQAVAA